MVVSDKTSSTLLLFAPQPVMPRGHVWCLAPVMPAPVMPLLGLHSGGQADEQALALDSQ
jgi:hypothetical protein